MGQKEHCKWASLARFDLQTGVLDSPVAHFLCSTARIRQDISPA